MTSRIASEVAEAMTLTTELAETAIYRKPTHANVLVDIAKKLQRLQTRAARQKKELKATLLDIRIAKRKLKAIAGQIGKGTA